MDKGPTLASHLINNSTIQASTDDDELENFVLQLDEADINNDDNFDDDLKEDDRLLNKEDIKEPSVNNGYCTKDSLIQEKQNEVRVENKLNEVNKLEQDKEDTRFSNHDRLEEQVIPKDKIVSSNDENSKTNCETSENICVKNGGNNHELQNEEQEAIGKIKETENPEKEETNEDKISKQNGSGLDRASNESSEKNPALTDNSGDSFSLPLKEDVESNLDSSSSTGNDKEVRIFQDLVKEEIEDIEDSSSIIGNDEESNSSTEEASKSALPSVKQDDDVIASIDKELDSLLGSEDSISEDTAKNIKTEIEEPPEEDDKNVSPTINGIVNDQEESSSSVLSNCRTSPTTDLDCTSEAVDKDKPSDASKMINNYSSRSSNESEQVSDQESNQSAPPYGEMLLDDDLSNTMDFKDSVGNEGIQVCTVRSRAEKSSQNNEKKSNQDVKNNSGFQVSKAHKRGTDSEEEHEIQSKKSKLSKAEEISQKKVPNGLSLKRKIEDIDNKETEVDKNFLTKKKVDLGMNKVNGNLLNEVKDYVKNDKDFMVHRQRLEKDYLNESVNYNVNRDAMDELVMMKVLEFVSYKSESGEFRQQGRFLGNEQVRLSKQVNSLRKQIEDAKHIIKKLIEEKVTDQPWTQQAIPLKVTRSVGLQVCTCGTVNMSNSKSKDRDSIRQLLSRNAEPGKKKTGTPDKSSSDDLLIVNEPAEDPIKEHPTNKVLEPKKIDKRIPDNERKTTPNTNPVKNGISQKVRNTLTSANTSMTISASRSRKDVSVPETSFRKDAASKTTDKPVEVSALIDLTDIEDTPTIKSEDGNSIPNTSASSITVKPPSALYPADKLANTTSKDHLNSSQSSPPNSKLWPPPVGGPTVRKPNAVPSSTPIRPFSSTAASEHKIELPKFPPSPKYPSTVVRPPRPNLRIGRNNSGKQGIMLSWSFDGGLNPSNIEEYQLYAYQENKPIDKNRAEAWKKVGDIKALPLPMACFLTQFVEGHKYHFIVRAVDKDKVLGDFSLPGSIILQSAVVVTSANSPPVTLPLSSP